MCDESHVERILEMVWRAVMRVPLEHWDASIVQPDVASMLTACVHIDGKWEGTVGLHAPENAARQAAASMLSVPVESVTTADVHDAWGELANQVGGNLKALLPGPGHLSLPAVSDGRSYLAAQPDADLIFFVVRAWDGIPIVATLMERLPLPHEVRGRYAASV